MELRSLKTSPGLKLPVLLAVFLVLAACVRLIPADYARISTKITRQHIDFKSINWFADRAEAAYLHSEQIKSRFPKTTRISTPEGTDVQYFLEVHPKKKLQLVSIRGSANLKNIIEDTRTKRIRDTKLGIRVHHGFHDVAHKIYQDIRPHLRKNYKVAATGHSLGAASGMILLMYLANDGFSIAPSVNFGQPKFTDSEGVERYAHLPVTRVVDSNDVISLFPPSIATKSTKVTYEHIGAEIILLKRKHFVFLDEHDASRISVGEYWRNFGRALLEDHAIGKYIQKIRELESGATQVSYAEREKYVE